jgi:hypothetical protein
VSDDNLKDGVADPSSEYLACAADASYFCHNYCIIDDTQGVAGECAGTTPFKLWPAQVQVFWRLMREKRLVMLKARQLGISWVVCSFVLWAALFKGNQDIFLFSKGQSEANELLRRIKAMYERLPDWLREILPRPEGETKRDFRLTNGSKIRSMPATKSSGVSYTASILVIDEAAHILQATELMNSVKPTIDAGGQMIVFSTANGVGGMFHSLWSKARDNKNGFSTVFLPWWARPTRTAEWFEKVRAESPDPKKIPQNYPATAFEAFVSSGRARFEYEWIEYQTKLVRSPTPRGELPLNIQAIPGVSLYNAPVGGRKYLICADVAEGLEDGEGDQDYSAGFVISLDKLAVQCVLHGRWEPDVFAMYMMKLAHWYSDARDPRTLPEIVVERNNHGHAVLTALKLSKYRRIGVGHDGKPGWLTNEVTREPAVSSLAGHLRDRSIIIHDEATIAELQSLHVNKRGISCAVAGSHDDRALALSIGCGFLTNALAKKHAQRAEIADNPFQAWRG